MKSLRIVFMGTPDFAVASMAALVNSTHNVVAVVTSADKPAGRGLLVSESPVKKYAVENSIPVLQPIRLRDDGFIQELKALEADLFVVVAFRMLPEMVWSMPPLGSINLHGSLLPKYRGAAPINKAIMNGEMETGVTTFFLQQEIDTGKVIRRQKIDIAADENAGELHDRMMAIGAQVLLDSVNDIANGTVSGQEQESLLAEGEVALMAPKIYKEDCRINWSSDVNKIHNFVRGLSPYPAAWTMIGEKTMKIFAGKKLPGMRLNAEFETDGKSYFRFRCADGAYDILDLQLEGKRRIGVEEFLRGWRGV